MGRFQSSIAPKNDRNCSRLCAIKPPPAVPILDRPEERSQCDLGRQLARDRLVPILDRPEERSQWLDRASTAFTLGFQSSIAPKNDRNADLFTITTFRECSNPRSPRRTIAMQKGSQKADPSPVPILDRPEERSQFPRFISITNIFRFQSSIAPKNDRNGFWDQIKFEDAKFQSSIAPKNDRN